MLVGKARETQTHALLNVASFFLPGTLLKERVKEASIYIVVLRLRDIQIRPSLDNGFVFTILHRERVKRQVAKTSPSPKKSMLDCLVGS